MFHNFYWAWEGVVDPEFCDYILSKSDWDNAESAKVAHGDGRVDSEKRITKVVWHDTHSPIAAVTYHYMMMANELAGWNFNIKYPQKVQVGKYVDGGHYDWHVDSFAPFENGLQRKLSCSLLLNDASEYEGGALEIKDVTKAVPTKKGSVIVFPSILLHRVTPVTSGVRYSAVCWALGDAFK